MPFTRALLFLLLGLTPTWALTPSQREILFNNVSPSWQWNFATSNTLPPDGSITVNSPSLGGLVTDSTGALTYAPNNLLTYSNTFSNAAWLPSNISVSSNLVTLTGTGLRAVYLEQLQTTHSFNRFVSFDVKISSGVRYFQILTDGITTSYANYDLQSVAVGSRGATISTSNITDLGGNWYRISYVDTSNVSSKIYISVVDSATASWAAATTVTAGSAFYLQNAVVSAVTYETTPRPGDQVITAVSAYYGPKFDYGKGIRIWVPRTNLFLNSATGATQSVTTTATPYTLSCWGTGAITLTGTSTAGPLTCSGATPASSVTPTSLTFTPTAGTLTLTVAGSATYVNLEQASFPGPRILTAASSVAAAADALTANAPLSTYLAAGPWAYSWTNGQTSVTSCVTGAAGGFSWPQNGWMKSLKVYKAGTSAGKVVC